MSSYAVEIPKLNHHNYQIWRSIINTYLYETLGSHEPDFDGIDKADDAKLLRVIRASVETDILISISKLNTTKDTLVELKKKYDTLDTEGRIEKMIRLFKSQLNNEDITKYISDKQNLFNEINSIKAEEGNELLLKFYS